MVKPVLAIGHSHLTALRRGFEQHTSMSPNLALDAREFLQIWGGGFDPIVEARDGALVYNPALEQAVLDRVEALRPEAIFSTLLGSEHFIWALQGNVRPFDVVLPDAPDLPRMPVGELVPYAMMRQLVHDSVYPTLLFNARMTALTSLPVYQILPPPPVVDERHIREYAQEPYKTMVAENGVPHRIMRYKLWRIWIEVAKRIAHDTGTITVDPPLDGLDAEGLVREEYCADGVHVTADFGAMIWRDVDTMMRAA